VKQFLKAWVVGYHQAKKTFNLSTHFLGRQMVIEACRSGVNSTAYRQPRHKRQFAAHIVERQLHFSITLY
jgi:hypothetical protein